MWKERALIDASRNVRRLTLSKNISAIPLVPSESGTEKLGVITQLPAGATVDVCGDGFNERTAKVRYADRYFFVFLQDLQEPGYLAATA
jgi:hypothetical protein